MLAKYREWNQCVVEWAGSGWVARGGWGAGARGLGCAAGAAAARGSRTPARARTALAPPGARRITRAL